MARYHVSRLGRLSSPDPLAGSTNDPQSLNRYTYSINDPANVADPSGLFPCTVADVQPSDSSQGGSSSHGGPSADIDDADAGANGGEQSTTCTESLWDYLDGSSSLDGGDITDTSGAMGMGFSEAGGIIAGSLGKHEIGEGAWEWNLLGYYLPEGPIGGGGSRAPGLPTFSQKAYDECAKKAFGGTAGVVPGSDRSIPGYDASLDVLQASLLVGADAPTVAITMAYESNSNLQVRTNLNSNGSLDIGPMQLNTDSANNGGFPYIFPGALTGPNGNFPLAGQRFSGNPLANIMTGALYLRSLGNSPQNYAAPLYRPDRAQALAKLDSVFRAFFDCLQNAAMPF